MELIESVHTIPDTVAIVDIFLWSSFETKPLDGMACPMTSVGLEQDFPPRKHDRIKRRFSSIADQLLWSGKFIFENRLIEHFHKHPLTIEQTHEALLL